MLMLVQQRAWVRYGRAWDGQGGVTLLHGKAFWVTCGYDTAKSTVTI
jgi:hypothetical protein